jgi:hypothetical protein
VSGLVKRRGNKFKTIKNVAPQKSYKTKFIISAEGAKTEVEYFTILKSFSDHIIKILNRDAGKSSPDKVLKDLKVTLAKEKMRKNDEAWIVIDVDSWAEEKIQEVIEFTKEKQNQHCAISNPKFEYWLLMHFETPKNALTSAGCDAAIKKHILNYNKGIPSSKIKIGNVTNAITRAKVRHTGTEFDYPKGNNNGSTVYLLVDKLLKKE